MGKLWAVSLSDRSTAWSNLGIYWQYFGSNCLKPTGNDNRGRRKGWICLLYTFHWFWSYMYPAGCFSLLWAVCMGGAMSALNSWKAAVASVVFCDWASWLHCIWCLYVTLEMPYSCHRGWTFIRLSVILMINFIFCFSFWNMNEELSLFTKLLNKGFLCCLNVNKSEWKL